MTTRTVELMLTFDVSRQDDAGWPWVVVLKSVMPRGTGLEGKATYDHPLALALIHPIQLLPPQKECSRCTPGAPDTVPGQRICDACAVEESIQNRGGEDWLATTDPPHVFNPTPVGIRVCKDYPPLNPALVIDHEGTIHVCGHMVWSYYSSVDGEYWDEEFCVSESRYEE